MLLWEVKNRDQWRIIPNFMFNFALGAHKPSHAKRGDGRDKQNKQ